MDAKTFFADLEAEGKKPEDFLLSVATGAKKLRAINAVLSGPVLAAKAAVFYDAVKSLADKSEGVATITLSESTRALVADAIADVKTGDAATVADFEALGIKL